MRNLNNFKLHLSTKNWDKVGEASKVEAAYNIFKEVLQAALDLSYPLKNKEKIEIETKVLNIMTNKPSLQIKKWTLQRNIKALNKYELKGNKQEKVNTTAKKREICLKTSRYDTHCK